MPDEPGDPSAAGARAAAAGLLCDARVRRERFAGFPTQLAPADEAQAYAVQDALHGCLRERGWGELVGYKIGCTTSVMQAYLGIRNPCAGGVFASTVYHRGAAVPYARFLRAGVECEVAVRLGVDLPPDGAPYDRDRIARAVDGCAAAIEIVDDRYVDFPSLDAPTLISDDFFGAGCVLGELRRDFDARDLDRVEACMAIDGRRVGAGVGRDILGHPLDALTWLANTVIARNRYLRAGEFILLGSLVQTHWVATGTEVSIANDPLGEIAVRFV